MDLELIQKITAIQSPMLSPRALCTAVFSFWRRALPVLSYPRIYFRNLFETQNAIDQLLW